MQEVHTDTAEQLGRLAAVYRDSKDNYEGKRDALHDAIVQAVDAGASVARVARLVGVSPQRVYAIIQRVDGRA